MGRKAGNREWSVKTITGKKIQNPRPTLRQFSHQFAVVSFDVKKFDLWFNVTAWASCFLCCSLSVVLKQQVIFPVRCP